MNIRWSVIIFLLMACSNMAIGQENTDTVVVLPARMAVPANARLLGHIRAGNHSTAVKCNYASVIAHAKRKAARLGGNLVKITAINEPVFISGCYNLSANIYSIPDVKPYQVVLNNTPRLPQTDTAKFATLYIYRLKDTLFPSARYDVHIEGDSILYRSKSSSTYMVGLPNKRSVTIWAAIGNRREVKLDLAFGKSYYLRCGVRAGNVRQEPVLELVDGDTGAREYRQLTPPRRETSVKYLDAMH